VRRIQRVGLCAQWVDAGDGAWGRRTEFLGDSACKTRTRYCTYPVPFILEYHIPLLERLDSIDASSIALFDFRTRSYRFLTDSFKFLAGYDRDDAIEGGPEYFFRIMRRDHLQNRSQPSFPQPDTRFS
jgi:hypothetical protein